MELKSIEDIYNEPYEFPDFYKQMTEGALWNLGRPVYVFLGAQRTPSSKVAAIAALLRRRLSRLHWGHCKELAVPSGHRLQGPTAIAARTSFASGGQVRSFFSTLR